MIERWALSLRGGALLGLWCLALSGCGIAVKPQAADVRIVHTSAPAPRTAPGPGSAAGSFARLVVTGHLELTNRRARPVPVDLSAAELVNGDKAAPCTLLSDERPLPSPDRIQVPPRGSMALGFEGSVTGPPQRLLLRLGRLGEVPLETIQVGAKRFEITLKRDPEVEKGAFRVSSGVWDVVVFEVAIRNNSSCVWKFDPGEVIEASDQWRADYASVRETGRPLPISLAPGQRQELELLYTRPEAGPGPYLVFRSPLEDSTLLREHPAGLAPEAAADLAEDPSDDFPRIDATQGPVYIFGQHHAAYYAIKRLQLHDALPWRGNVLVNFDAHSDAWNPGRVMNPEDRDRALRFLHDPKLTLEQKTERLRAFTKDMLNVGTWIIPLIDDGSLDAYYWIAPRVSPLEELEKQVDVVQLHRRFADMSTMVPGLKAPRVPPGFAFRVGHDDALPSANEIAGKPLIVTFDLDYFSCRWAGEDGRRVWVAASTPEQTRAAAASAINGLKSRGLRPEVFLLAESPGFAPRSQWPLITDALLSELRSAGLAP